MKTILLVIFTLAIEVCCFSHSIDLERCDPKKKDAACFVRDSCIKQKDRNGNEIPGASGDAGKLTHFKEGNADNLVEGKCEVIMQIKAFTEHLWHVMIEVKKTTDNLKSTEGIKIMQKKHLTDVKDQLIFDCKDDQKNSDNNILKTETRGDNQNYDTTRIFCSILVEGKNHPEISKNLKDYEGEPFLWYETDMGEQIIKYEDGSDEMWTKPVDKCNVSKVISRETNDELYLLHEIDTTLSEMKCSNDSHQLRISYNDTKLALTRKLSCTVIGKYKPDEKDYIAKEAEIEAYCAEEFCTFCSPLGTKKCQGCSNPDDKIESESKCKTPTCPNWRLDDGSVVNATVKCQRKEKGQMSVGWFMIVGSERREITEGACSDKFDCHLFSTLKFTDCSTCKKPVLSPDQQTISCPDGFELRFSKDTKSASNVTCNAANGLYVYGKEPKEHLEKNEQIFCKKSEKPAASAPSKGGLTPGATAGIVIGIILIVVIICIIVMVLCRRRKQREQKTQPTTSTNNDEVKTAIYAKSNEPINDKVTKSQSGSEAPPSTDRKMQNSGDEKDEKKDEKKEEKSNNEKSKKEDKSNEKKEEKREERKEDKAKMAKKLPKMERKPVPNTLQVKKELEAQLREKREGIDMKATGKRMDASDLDVDQIKFANNPGSKLKRWDESDFKDLLLPDVHMFKVPDRLTFLRHLSVFHYLTSKEQNSDYGTVVQFFRVVKKCMDKKLDCPPSWEILFRTIKLFCHHLPQKEGADVIRRMRLLMIDCARMMVKRLGFVRRMREDINDNMLARAQAMRILLWAEDEICLEALKTAAESKVEEVEPHLQAVVFSYAVNKMGKKDELEARYKEEIKTGMEYPHEVDEKEKTEMMPFGTLRQHLIFALCSNKDSSAMEEFLRGLSDYTPTDFAIAFLGATEHVANFEKTLTIFTEKDLLLDDIFPAVLDKFTKSEYQRDYVKTKMKEDLEEMCYATGMYCITDAQFMKWNMTASGYYYYDPKKGSAFDSKAMQERAINLDKMLKDKKCIEWIDEGLKRVNY